MTLWILDTDHVSLFQTGHPLITQKVRSLDPNAIAVTIVTILVNNLDRIFLPLPVGNVW